MLNFSCGSSTEDIEAHLHAKISCRGLGLPFPAPSLTRISRSSGCLRANGCGTGALKIFRGMHERTVTAPYISKFPEEAGRFWNYSAVANRRLLNQAKKLYGGKQLKQLMYVDSLDEAEKAYLEVRHDYEEALCEPCKKVRTGLSWSKLGLPAMAKKAGYGLERCYWHAYAIPTQQAHSTVLAAHQPLFPKSQQSSPHQKSPSQPKIILLSSTYRKSFGTMPYNGSQEARSSLPIHPKTPSVVQRLGVFHFRPQGVRMATEAQVRANQANGVYKRAPCFCPTPTVDDGNDKKKRGKRCSTI